MVKKGKKKLVTNMNYRKGAAKPVIKRPVVGLAGNVGKKVKGGRNSKL